MSTESILQKLELIWDEWALPFETACFIYDHILATKPSTILECGSGNSTVVILKAIEKNGFGSLISLEQSEQFLEGTSIKLQMNDLDFQPNLAKLRLYPIEVSGISCYWYDVEPLKQAPYKKIQLAFIDGPSIVGRVGSLPILWPFLEQESMMILDDGQREGEVACTKYWEYLFGDRIETQYSSIGRGVWQVTKKSCDSPSNLNRNI